MIIALTVIASVMPIVFILVELKKGGAAGVIAKSAASLCFVALGAAEMTRGDVRARILILFGLVCGLVGDILLGVFKPDDERLGAYLPAGMTAFALEHAAVITAVSLVCDFKPVYLVLSLIIGAVLAVLTVITEKKLMKFDFGVFTVPSLLYAFVLASALVYYIIVTIKQPEFLTVTIGMILFFISDMVLSVMYFGGKSKSAPFTAANLSTYYAGQILFAVSMGHGLFGTVSCTIF